MNRWLTIIFMFFFLPAVSQDINIKKEKRKAKTELLNDNYKNAIRIYLPLLDETQDDYEIYSNLGFCYFQTKEYFEAITYLEKSYEYYINNNKLTNKNSRDEMTYLAEAYIMNYNFMGAKAVYQKIAEFSRNAELTEMQKLISQCDSAQNMLENPKGFFVYRPGIVNSDYPDYAPILDYSRDKIYFTSRKPGSTGGKKDLDGYEYEDIYSVDINNGEYSTPVKLSSAINSDGYEATASISFDGNSLFIYKSSDADNGDIYISKFKNGQWSTPKRMDAPINSKYRETHASLSPDGKTIFFTSDRENGEGGLDIYTAELSPDGKWINAQNMGPIINTDKDEEGPFCSPDGKYLYFSSNGHSGMGGFDIYKSEKGVLNKWSRPVNMGFPLNTVNDDIFYVPTNNPEEALYSSTQMGGMSSILIVQIYDIDNDTRSVRGNIFETDLNFINNSTLKNDSITYNNKRYPLNNRIYTENDTTHLFFTQNGYVLDSVSKIPSNTSIKVIKVPSGTLLGTYTSSKQGKYQISTSEKGNFIVHYSSPGYSYDYYEIGAEPRSYYYDAKLDTLVEGEIKIIKYSNFQKDSTYLSSYQEIELLFLTNFLQKNQNLCVDISSYKNNNEIKDIDKDRSKLIEDYLLSKDIAPSRIFFNKSSDNIKNNQVQYTVYDTVSIHNDSIINKVEEKKIISNRVVHGVLVNDVRFELNEYKSPEFYDDLDFLATFLLNNEEARIGIYGYTDIQGNVDFNKVLSQKRAGFVKDYLIGKGVKTEQLEAEGKGYSKQIAINKNDQGNYIWESMKYNRRVEIEVLQQGIKEKLFVKPVDVPNQFQMNVSKNTYYYSINILSSENKLPASAFDFNVTELLGVDGLYNYIYGEFEHEYEAIDFASTIKNKFPNAFVFINNFRQ